MAADTRHPNLKQFAKALADHQVDGLKARAFDKWRGKLEKAATGPDEDAAIKARANKVEADRLWAEYEAAGNQASSGLRRQTFEAAQVQRRDPRSGRGASPSAPNSGTAREGRPRQEQATSAARRGDNAAGAPAAVLGAKFHNPYTFIPFPTSAPRRCPPTPLTIDEDPAEREHRFTGILDVKLRTLSPLLTCSPLAKGDESGHKTFEALRIENDVIVPASGVRGALRTLMSVLTGGTLGYLDDGVWLCQGRDRNLGPRGQRSPGGIPESVFLARVMAPGTASHPGRVRVGRTKLVKWVDLESAAQRAAWQIDRPRHYWCNEDGTSFAGSRDAKHSWQIKLSGRPINQKGKREGLFLDDGGDIDLPAGLWAAYLGRHRHGERPELREGDLVWLEPTDPSCAAISSTPDVRSIQWARWGREGERLLDDVRDHHKHVLPDAFNPDGLVDEVTDLFGQVPRPDLTREAYPDWTDTDPRPGPAGPFAARVRPENLVFFDKVQDGLHQRVTLAPLAAPHPGCAAFYRDVDDPDEVTNHRLGLRGYKVYRTTNESDTDAPWKFENQAVYNDRGTLKSARQPVNKTCDLVKKEQVGRLRVTCRALSKRELALLFAACSVDWRLGGGKPLGLGWCRIDSVKFTDEEGRTLFVVDRRPEEEGHAPLPSDLAKEIADVVPRLKLWQDSQRPVAHLRYPRAVGENNKRKQRGGHVWFQRHAQPRKVESGEGHPKGLQVLWVDGELKDAAGGKDRIRAQPLPRFDTSAPEADVLNGFDLFAAAADCEQLPDKRTLHSRLVPFDPEAHARPTDRSGGPQGQSRATRQRERDERRR